MTLFNICFFFFGLVTIAGALFILFSKSVVHSAFALMGCLTGVAGIFILSGADFLGIAQVMIYVGGILVLLLFGIMMTRRLSAADVAHSKNSNIILGGLSGVALFTILTTVIIKIDFTSIPWIAQNSDASKIISKSTIPSIGMKLMTDYILPFELAALILMVALIGAAFISAQVVNRKH